MRRIPRCCFCTVGFVACAMYPAHKSHLIATFLRISSKAPRDWNVSSGPGLTNGDATLSCVPMNLVKKLLKRCQDDRDMCSSFSILTIEIAPYGQRSAQMPQPIQLSVMYTSPSGCLAMPALLHNMHTGS